MFGITSCVESNACKPTGGATILHSPIRGTRGPRRGPNRLDMRTPDSYFRSDVRRYSKPRGSRTPPQRPMSNSRGSVVAAGHALTVATAEDVLRAGGNAYDAALAALATSFVAEPVLSSPGGGGFLLAAPAEGPPRVYDFFVQTPLEHRPLADIDFLPGGGGFRHPAAAVPDRPGHHRDARCAAGNRRDSRRPRDHATARARGAPPAGWRSTVSS